MACSSIRLALQGVTWVTCVSHLHVNTYLTTVTRHTSQSQILVFDEHPDEVPGDVSEYLEKHKVRENLIFMSGFWQLYVKLAFLCG